MVNRINIRAADSADKDFIESLVPRLTEFGLPVHRDEIAMILTDTKILTGILSHHDSEHEIFIAENENQNTRARDVYNKAGYQEDIS